MYLIFFQVCRMLTACSVRDVVANLSLSVKNIKDYLQKAHKGANSPLLVIIDDFLKRNKQVLSKKKKGQCLHESCNQALIRI